MSYSLPRYIGTAAVDDPQLRFLWDDWRASELFETDSSDLPARLEGVALRAKIAVGIGIYEWVIGRFASHSPDPIPFQVAESAWCATVHRAYMEPAELPRDEWIGPVRGPLWCAVTWLVPMVLSGDNDPEECESGLDYLPRLAVHVLPDRKPFETWLDAIVERLHRLYPVPPESPFDDLFSDNEEARRGPLVSREVLDPQFNYTPESAAELASRFLGRADHRTNPYLISPERLTERGFTGTPYLL